jgi:SAM-dependent methyltransferase
VAEGDSVPVEGWDFSWFEGRATEQRPSWGYAGLLVGRLAGVESALDVQTGGGEAFAWVLGQLSESQRPHTLAATESWQPNALQARERLSPFGATVREVADDAPHPFDNCSFELVVSRHPVTTVWPDIARVLRPGGVYLSQQVGAGSNRELTEFLMGPQPLSGARCTARAVTSAEAAGLTVVDLRQESLLVQFNDIGAVVHFLRKVLWTVPGFTVAAYRDRLADLHARIQPDGPFTTHAQRFLIEARRSE